MKSKKTNNQSIKDFLFALIKNKWALTSIIWLFIIIAIAIFASQLAPFDPNKNNIMERVAPPLTLDKQGNMKYLIGSDALGRDSFSRLIFGAQVSLIVGFSAVLVGGILGTALGVRKAIDEFVQNNKYKCEIICENRFAKIELN